MSKQPRIQYNAIVFKNSMKIAIDIREALSQKQAKDIIHTILSAKY